MPPLFLAILPLAATQNNVLPQSGRAIQIFLEAPLSLIFLLSHLFLQQQMVSEHLLYDCHCAMDWRYRDE